MIPDDKQQASQQLLKQNKALDKIIFSISSHDTISADPDLNIAYAEEYVALLKRYDRNHLVDSVLLKADENVYLKTLNLVQQNLPYLLRAEDYQRLENKLHTDSIQAQMAFNLRTLSSPSGLVFKQVIQKDPLGISYLALQKLSGLQLDDETELYDGYFFHKNKPVLSFFVTSKNPNADSKRNEELASLLFRVKEELRKKPDYKNIDCVYFGGQLVAAGNAQQMRQDTWVTLSITVVLLLALFLSFFRSVFAPLQVMIPVAFGGLFSMAMMYWLKGEVSAMALGASSVILGIAVNYSLHFLSHLRSNGDKTKTIAELAEPMTIGGFTTIAAFLSLQLVNAPVLQQLGLFAAFSLIGSSICTLLFLPHFTSSSLKVHAGWIDRLASLQPEKNKWLVLLVFGVTVVLSLFMGRVKFTEDMMQVNYMTNELKEAQHAINALHAESLNTVFCIHEGTSWNEVLEKNTSDLILFDSLKKENLLRKYAAIGDFLLSEKEAHVRIQRWKNFWSTERIETTHNALQAAAQTHGFQLASMDTFLHQVNRKYTLPDANYQQHFRSIFNDFIFEQPGKITLMSPLKTTQENRSSIWKRFENNTHAKLADRQQTTSRIVQLVKDDFYNILFYTSFIVFFTILLTYGRIELSIISFLPMLLTWICILGLMGLFYIEFNIINVIISTLIFGLGDDYGIFITDSLLEKYKYGRAKIHTVKTSIYLSAITTIIGLGILMVAKHPALKSIAAVSVIGILSILFVSQTIQPLLFNFFIQKRADKGKQPFTLWSFAKTIFAFTYYVVGCLLVTLIGFVLIKCVPFAKTKMKYVYHVVVCKMMWSLLYIMANVKKSFANKRSETFQKPAVIIANHTSFLDLLRIISLHPKILLLTNRWVWRSPVFGALVRMADYYPVEEGAEFSVDKLKYWVNKGYSIAVFPEGTRSYTDQIGRFKKGAFYLAEQLNLEIIPAVFHGIANTMSKGDFLLKNGEINVKFLPRIALNDQRFGSNYTERAKLIGRYFREEHERYRVEREVPKYFYERLMHTYKYKGPVLEWYARIKVRLENYYAPIEQFVPKQGAILNLGCGYGFLDYMLQFTSKERSIIGVDYDAEKIAIAQHGYTREERLQFVQGDISEFEFNQRYDAILLMDVLHYLSKDKQQALLIRCAQSLHEQGVLIVRDGMSDVKTKHRGTILSEIFSTKLFRFNKTTQELSFPSSDEMKIFAEQNNLTYTLMNDTRFTSNLMFVFKPIVHVN